MELWKKGSKLSNFADDTQSIIIKDLEPVMMTCPYVRELFQIKKNQTEFLSCQEKNFPDWIDRIDSDPNGFKGLYFIPGLLYQAKFMK